MSYPRGSRQINPHDAFLELSDAPKGFMFASAESIQETGELRTGTILPDQIAGAKARLGVMAGVILVEPELTRQTRQPHVETPVTQPDAEPELVELLVESRAIIPLSIGRSRQAGGESSTVQAARSLFESHVLLDTQRYLEPQASRLLGGVAVYPRQFGKPQVGLVASRTLLSTVGNTARTLTSLYDHAPGDVRREYSERYVQMIHWLRQTKNDPRRLSQLTAETTVSILDRSLPSAARLHDELASQQSGTVVAHPTRTREPLLPIHHSSPSVAA